MITQLINCISRAILNRKLKLPLPILPEHIKLYNSKSLVEYFKQNHTRLDDASQSQYIKFVSKIKCINNYSLYIFFILKQFNDDVIRYKVVVNLTHPSMFDFNMDLKYATIDTNFYNKLFSLVDSVIDYQFCYNQNCRLY